MSERVRTEHAASFGQAAAAYERGRPGYPDAALDWLIPDGARAVGDLGAGTGKLTRQLVARGLQVSAVEPSADMLQQLNRNVPGAAAQQGSAEQTGWPDGRLDAVLVAQAWHWVDASRAVPEVARVLRPGGVLGLLWNLRKIESEFEHELETLIGGADAHHAGGVGWDHTDPAGLQNSPFRADGEFEVGWNQPLRPEQVVDLVASRSYVITQPSERRRILLDRVDDLARTHSAADGTVTLGYRTWCLRYRTAG